MNNLSNSSSRNKEMENARNTVICFCIPDVSSRALARIVNECQCDF